MGGAVVVVLEVAFEVVVDSAVTAGADTTETSPLDVKTSSDASSVGVVDVAAPTSVRSAWPLPGPHDANSTPARIQPPVLGRMRAACMAAT